MIKFITLLTILVQTTITFAQLPAGDRIFGLQIDSAEDGNYDSAFAHGQDACMSATAQAFSWKGMEPEPEQIGGFLFELLDVVNIYFPPTGVRIELNIPIINTVTREVPADLEDEPFDSPLFIDRFNTMLDSLFSRIPDVELLALNIGNELGYYLAEDTLEFNAYKTFLDSAKVHAEMLYEELHGEDLLVGTTVTWGALTNPATSALMQDLNQHTDIVSVTYYPLNEDFTARAPSAVFEDFNSLVEFYPDPAKPIYFAECGYPSSALCNSSEVLQQNFAANVFSSWDEHMDNIVYLNFFHLTDWSQEAVDGLAEYYGLPNNVIFKEYLRSLGIRTFPGNGTNKLAYDECVAQASARGFCDATGLESPDRLLPAGFELAQNYPNPFNPNTTLSYELNHSAFVTLSIFDLQGRLVKTLVNEDQGAGSHTIPWDATNTDGTMVTSGVYVYRLGDGSRTAAHKMLLIK